MVVLVAVSGGVLLLTHKLGGVSFVLAGIAALAYYRFDCWRRPRRPCLACHGTGANFSRFGRSGYRPLGNCWCCKGKKTHPRLMSRILAPSQHRAIKSGQKTRNW